MFKKSIIYSSLIIIIYIISCIFIYNQTTTYIAHSNDKNNNIKYKQIVENIKETNSEDNPIATLEIDKISLKNNIYDIDSNLNNVDKNVTLLKNSILPDKSNSILFIAAHSGSGVTAFFERLNELKKGDKIKFNYNNKAYIYYVDNFWEEEKNGYIHIEKQNKKQLILTTCSPNKSDKQLIVSCLQN